MEERQVCRNIIRGEVRMSLAIKNGQIFINNGLIKKNILVENSKIKKITNNNIKAEKTIDASGKIVLPGIIDSHVHMREPGQEYKEDFFSGSCAAAAGGVTTFLDMPNNKPPILTALDLEKKRQAAKKSIVNYGFYFGTDGKNINEFKKISNVATLKVYMDKTTGNLIINDESVLNKIFMHFKRIAVHAEEENVERAIKLAIKNKSQLHLCHISSREEINLIRNFKNNKECKIFVEVTPHHLFLTKEDEKNSFFMMKPGLKTKKDQDALWKAIKDGTMDRIATDHAPHTITEKESENPPYGVPGIETMLPLLLDAVNNKKLSLNDVVRLTIKNPAEMFGIKNKGRIETGFDADLVIVDMKKTKTVSNKNLFTKCRWSPWHGKELRGWPITTIVNGNVVFNNNKIENINAKEVMFNNKR